MTPAQRNAIKSPENIASLCDAALVAYKKASPQARSKTFTWRDHKFRARWSVYCIYIDDMKGNPIARRVW